MSEEEKLQLEQECLLKYSKAQMIQKYIDELEENCTLSDLWCKSQEENKQLKEQLQQKENIIKEVREKLEYLLTHDKVEINGTIYLKQEADDFITNYILEILDKENK